MKTAIMGTVLVVFGILIAVHATAGVRDDCIDKCKQAAAFIQTKGLQAGIKEIGNKNGRFIWNDGISYIFLMDMNAKMLAHPYAPHLTKKETLIDLLDVTGKRFNVDIVEAAKKGKGWTHYYWEVPGLKVQKPKYSFIYRVPGADYFVGAGYFVLKAGFYR